MDTKFRIMKIYTKMTTEEFEQNVKELESIESSEIIVFNNQKFYPFVYELVDGQTYRFDGYDVTVTIDGQRDDDHSGFLQPIEIAKYHKMYSKSTNGASESLRIYKSLSETNERKSKYLETYKMNKKFSDFYGLFLKKLKESE